MTPTDGRTRSTHDQPGALMFITSFVFFIIEELISQFEVVNWD